MTEKRFCSNTSLVNAHAHIQTVCVIFRVMKTNLLERQTTDIDPEMASSANVTKMARTIMIMRKDGSESPFRITPLPGSKICMIVQIKGKCNFFFCQMG